MGPIGPTKDSSPPALSALADDNAALQNAMGFTDESPEPKRRAKAKEKKTKPSMKKVAKRLGPASTQPRNLQPKAKLSLAKAGLGQTKGNKGQKPFESLYHRLPPWDKKLKLLVEVLLHKELRDKLCKAYT